MNANVKMKFNNTYQIELIDSLTGKVKQSGEFHNTVTIGILTSLISGQLASTEAAQDTAYHCGSIFGSIDVGNGTAQPSFNDTKLTSLLWSKVADSKSMRWLDEYTAQGTAVYTFPATSQYVGTVTEVGLKNQYIYNGWNYGDNYVLCTHSLLTDSEGQQISFNKTDLDVLKITAVVEMSLQSTTDAFKIFKYPLFLYEPLMSRGRSLTAAFGMPGFSRFMADMEGRYGSLSEKTTQTGTVRYKTSANESYAKYSNCRFPSTDITSERYYKGLVIPGIGYWKLPNEEVFPTYTISGIPIGTGDGSTTTFANPLSYFKKDTEKIYKNGVQLVRGTDYTINHMSNKGMLPELAEIGIKRVSSDVNNVAYTGGLVSLIASSYTTRERSSHELSKYARLFNSESPLYIEFEEPVTRNALYSNGSWLEIRDTGNNSYGGYYLARGTTFYVDYSTDGQQYHELGSYTTTQAGSSTQSTTAFGIDFPATTAKYWRVRTSSTHAIGINSADYYMMLSMYDPDIVFTQAPADGDVLTMDVGMDYIMKNDKFVVDVDAQVDISL